MIIEGSFYKITPVDECSNLYDLEFLYEVGGKNPHSEFKVAGYGMPFLTVLKSIVRRSLNNKYGDEVIDLPTYIKEYTNELKKLRKEIHGL